jgi:hypothetical protein
MTKCLAVFAVLLGTFGGGARAEDIQIDFLGAGPGGSVSYGGGAAPLVGYTSIGGVRGINTLKNSTSSGGAGPFSRPVEFLVDNGDGLGLEVGLLSFTTGNLKNMNGSTYEFDGGGSFEITGQVRNRDGSIAVAYDSANPLLKGNLLGASVGPAGSVQLAITTGTDEKHPDLVRFFGLNPLTTQFAFSGSIHLANFVITDALTNAFSAMPNGSTNITNTVVPEPTSVLLLASVFVFVAAKLRRKLT